MRCPYCGGINSDRAAYCTSCGRDLTQPSNQSASGQQPPYQQPRPASPTQGYAQPSPPRQQPRHSPPPVPRQTPPMPQQPAQNAPGMRQQEAPIAAPEPPAPFPPRSVAQLQALEQGALAYTVVETTMGDGRKKIVRIVYPKCAAWQQVATLFKAFKEQQETCFDTIIIQGVLAQNPGVYAFTNGQVYFDRNVRLGSQTTNRYQIETGNGFESDSMRIVLTE